MRLSEEKPAEKQIMDLYNELLRLDRGNDLLKYIICFDEGGTTIFRHNYFYADDLIDRFYTDTGNDDVDLTNMHWRYVFSLRKEIRYLK